MYLSEPNGVVEMLGQAFLSIVIDVDSDRVEEILLNNGMLDKIVLDFLGPLGWRRDILPDPCSNVGAWLC